MPLSPQQLREVLSRGESERVEFKQDLRDPAQLAKLIAAFANTAGGIIVVGFREPDNVVGTAPERIGRLYERALAKMSPPPATRLGTVSLDGRQLVTIEVDQANELTLTDAGAFQRVGETVRAMPPSEIAFALGPALDRQRSVATSGVDSVAEALSTLTLRIEELQGQLAKANSPGAQLKNYFIGGLIGAILSLLLTVLFA